MQHAEALGTFRLRDSFVSTYAAQHPPFGFNGLGELVYSRTYARMLPDGSKERWHQTVERVVNGTFRLQRRWMERVGLGWDTERAQAEAQEMYDRIFTMRMLPPGRGLWAMGSALTEEKRLYAALNNCAFVSTADMAADPARPFCFLMDAAMLGVGVGFDTRGQDTVKVVGPATGAAPHTYVVPDSREGWVESLRLQLHSYLRGGAPLHFDYSELRPAGALIRGFGGVSSGPGTLRQLHEEVTETLEPLRGTQLTSTAIVDIMNKIGKCVVSGNVRRTAEIAFGYPWDDEYLDLKDYQRNPHRAGYGWASNNSVFATVGMDYEGVCRRVVRNGEPGFAWLENMRTYGRMGDAPTHADWRASGGNPCLEQTLESYEMCCLVETFPARHQSLEDFLHTLRYAMLYAKTVTLGETHWPETNRVMLRNRRIGCSMSGIAQFLASHGLDALKRWCEQGYTSVHDADVELSERFAVPRSIKTTSIKPSGTVSLLAGATPGMHYPESRFYIRRVRLGMDHPLVPALRHAGYKVEPAVEGRDTAVVEIPVDVGPNVRTVADVSMWEQLALAAFLQRYWADNQVSCTVTFDPEAEGPQLHHALQFFQYQLKGVSFLPRVPMGAYPQMPYEAITEEQYNRMSASLTPLHIAGLAAPSDTQQPVPDKFCDTDACAAVDGEEKASE